MHTAFLDAALVQKFNSNIYPGGTPHMKGVGVLIGNFERNP